MRVGIDLDICQGHAVCELEAPDVFEVEHKGKAVLIDSDPPDSRELRAAVRYCPTQALRLEEES
ncbi:ferredoxin [Actinocorallia longicatena]|uniref:Ferredoxin n=1 Tax=Actinocorallia longicatena TaxID=111803 RepID=A0ABP6QA56_9ACTN